MQKVSKTKIKVQIKVQREHTSARLRRPILNHTIVQNKSQKYIILISEISHSQQRKSIDILECIDMTYIPPSIYILCQIKEFKYCRLEDLILYWMSLCSRHQNVQDFIRRATKPSSCIWHCEFIQMLSDSSQSLLTMRNFYCRDEFHVDVE